MSLIIKSLRPCIWVMASWLLIFFPAGTATGKLIIRGSDNYPPFEFINQAGDPDGFNVDIIRALMRETGHDYDLKLENWATVLQGIKNKEIDVAIGMIYSAERAESVRFTLPTCVINRKFITRKTDNYNNFSDLEGKEVIVEKDGWFHRYLLQNHFSGKIIESNDVYESLKLLASGKHDAALASELGAIYAIRQLGIDGLKIADMGILPQDYAIVVNQDEDELLKQLNLGLQHLKLSGTYDQIYNKWFGIYESRTNSRKLFIALGIFIAVASLLILFVWLLRRQVARATRLLNCSKQEVEIAIEAGRISAWTYTFRDRNIAALHGKTIGAPDGSIDEFCKTIHPDDIAPFREQLTALSTTGKQASSLVFRVRGQETEPYRYIETKMLRAAATRELPDRIVGTFKDISDEIQMRQQLEDYRIKSEFIIRTNDIILIQYDIANRRFVRISETNANDRRYYNIDQYLAMVYPEDIDTARFFIARLDKAEEPRIETEFRISTEDGDYYWYTIAAFAYAYDETGKITHYMGLRRNNSKWKEINNDLIQLREKAETSNRLKSAFLANMSHEIRTPLNAIVGFSELIIETGEKQEREKFIEIVRTNNNLLLQLISDILDLSKIEAGHIDFCYKTFDFPTYFQELAESLKIKESENVRLQYTNRYSDLKVRSDRTRISQVITNFITNAFKFTETGSVTMDYQYENDGIKVSVTDTGIGIAEDNQARIFDRFEKINDFAQGTGLGLSICKVIAEALQGLIGVESEPGKGSTFWFWFPCDNDIAEDSVQFENCIEKFPLPAATVSETNNSSETILSPEDKKTVLVAEDIDNNYLIIKNLIKPHYHIIRAKNGAEAVEKTQLCKPDMILMDMKMPVMDGLLATKEIRKFNPEIPIIALTAYVFDTNRQDALHAGCNDFLTKPLNRSVLMQILHNLEQHS